MGLRIRWRPAGNRVNISRCTADFDDHQAANRPPLLFLVSKRAKHWSVALGVGTISRPTNWRASASPLASVMRLMKISRMSACAGSTSTVSRRGRTFSVTDTDFSLASSMSLTWLATTRLPATRIGQVNRELASRRALWRMTFLSPPSVPPLSRMMSQAAASTLAMISSSISNP